MERLLVEQSVQNVTLNCTLTNVIIALVAVILELEQQKDRPMGKHIKTQMDYDMIEQLAREVHKLDPDNSVLAKFSSMDNYEGAELRKSLGVK